MITGYNTDVRHNEVVFHVQTEDKGLANPFIESLIYVGGQVLASRRSGYSEMLAEGKDEKDIIAVMDHQHRTMIAAIRHGKFDAKVQSLLAGKQTGPMVPPPAPPDTDTGTIARGPLPLASPSGSTVGAVGAVTPPGALPAPGALPPMLPMGSMGPMGMPTPPTRPLPPPMPVLPPLPPPSPSSRERTLDQVILEYLTNEADQEQLVLLLEEHENLALGQEAKLALRTRSSKSGMPIVGTQVSVRMISTVSDPVVLALGRTDDDGLAVLSFGIPTIGRGTAALIISAAGSIGRAELKHLL